MKRHKHSILAVLAALLWGSLSATPYRPVWEIGRKDGSAARVRVVRRRVFRPSGPVPRRGGRVRRRAQHTGRDPLYPARAPGRMGRQRQRIAADPLRGRCASLPGGDAADTLPGRIAGLVTPDRSKSPQAGSAPRCRRLPGTTSTTRIPNAPRHAALRSRPYCRPGHSAPGKTSSRSAMPAAAGSSGTPSSSKPTAA